MSQQIAIEPSDTERATELRDDHAAHGIDWWLPDSSTFSMSFELVKLSNGGKPLRQRWHQVGVGMMPSSGIWRLVSTTTASARSALKALHSASGKYGRVSLLSSFRTSSTGQTVWTLVLAHGWTSAERSMWNLLEILPTQGSSEDD